MEGLLGDEGEEGLMFAQPNFFVFILNASPHSCVCIYIKRN